MEIKDFSQFVCVHGRQPAQPAEIIDVAKHAEELGFHSIQLPHAPLLPYPEERPPYGGIAGFIPEQFRHYQYDPLVLLPMIAQATKTIRVGFNVLVTPFLHPFVWAKYLATLDAASNGRLVAGFGIGYAPPNAVVKGLHNIGIDSSKRGSMADEALELIVKLWTSDHPVDFEGKHYKGIQLAVDPKPVQKPYPELWWAGDARPSIARAARYANYLEVMWPPASEIKDRFVPELQRETKRSGRDCRISDLIYAEVLPGDLSRDELAGVTHVGYKEDAFAIGTPDTCAGVIRKLHEAGVAHFALDMHRHGKEHVSVIHEQMEHFVNEVLPLL